MAKEKDDAMPAGDSVDPRQPVNDTTAVAGGRISARVPIWFGFLCLILWTRLDSPLILAAASVCVAPAPVTARRCRRHSAGLVLLAAGGVPGFSSNAASRRMPDDGRGSWAELRAALAAAVSL